jgi:aminoglycoside phosphotransferase (APT) family kinase protein
VTDAAVAWAAATTGRDVVSATRLTGGMTSTMLRLAHAEGEDTVLRLVTEEPWRRHGAALTRREADTQRTLAATPVPAPGSLAVDEHGEHAGVAAHLMTYLPGEPDPTRADDPALQEMARLLASIHDVAADPPPRDFETWAWEEKRVVPPWAEDPATWRRAFAVLTEGEPAYERCFLQRDFGPRNLLWEADRVAGVVDWVETSTGPAWLDVAHGATNLALRHGTEVAHRFRGAYAAETGRSPEPYWDVVDVVGFLPTPGGPAVLSSPVAQQRTEHHLARVLERIG